jgi:acyl-CoA thioester hydrolase
MTGSETYRVCFADTDAGGIVYHARYFEMAERGRNAVLAAAGFQLRDFYETSRLVLVLHRATLLFAAPALLDDVLTLDSGILALRSVRSCWRTVIRRDDSLICQVDVDLVCLERGSRRLIAFPPELETVLRRVPRTAPSSGRGGAVAIP